MQEPVRCSLATVVQKNMKANQRKIYLHRIIYIANYVSNPDVKNQEEKSFIILIDSNIKLVNEDYCEDKITGFGLFYTGYFINMVEGPESTLVKHLKVLSECFEKNLSKTPKVTRMKILPISYHIHERYFTSWHGCQAIPPVLLDKIAPSALPEENARQIHNCLTKLHNVYKYLRDQPQNLLRAAMNNVSDLCRAHLPEINLLDFLLDSPGLTNINELLQTFLKIPDCTLYHEIIWPIPPDFVPYKILEDSYKELMTFLDMKDVQSSENGQEKKETNDKTEMDDDKDLT